MMHKVIWKRRGINMGCVDQMTKDQRTENKGRIATKDTMVHNTKTSCTIRVVCLKRQSYIWLQNPGSKTGVKEL
jgi:hypothetical protein